MGKKSRENQQKKKEAEASANSAQPGTSKEESKPETTTEEKKDWKRKDLKKAKAAQQASGESQQQSSAPQPRAGPQPGPSSSQPQGQWSQAGQPRAPQQGQGQPQQQGQYGGQRPPQQGGQQQSQWGGQRPPQQGGQQQGQWGGQRPPQQGGGQQHQGYQQRQQGDQSRGSWQQGGQRPQQGGGGQQGYQQRPQGQQYQQRGPPSQGQARGGYTPRNDGAVAEGSKFEVEANYVDLIIPTNLNEAYHYDVKIDPDRPKKMYRKAVDMYCKMQFQDILVAFDGRASAYSSVKLPENQLVTKTVTVTPEIGRPKEFKVTLIRTKDYIIDMSVLRTYGESPGGLANKPMRAIQCLEVVLAHQCHEKGVKAGRSFFYRPDNPEDLLDNYELWYGLFQAAILGKRMLLNIDVSHKAFPKPSTVLKVFDELVKGQRGHIRNFEAFMKDSDIIYEPPKSFNAGAKQYKVNRVATNDTAKTYRFPNEEGRQMTVFDYYKERGYTLKFPDYPLIHVGKREGNTYLPIELCKIAENQANNKQTAQRQVTEIIKHSAISSWDRKKKILALFQYFHAKSSPIIEKFGVKLGHEFIKIFATRLFAPKLEYKERKIINPVNGSWRADHATFYKPAVGKGPLRWCIINLEQRINEGAIRNMGSLLIKTCQRSGVNIEDKPQFEVKRADSRNIKETLANCVSNYDFVIVVLSRYGTSYADVKQAAELEKGMLTQCIKADTVERRANDSTLANILLKLNSKLNGINQKIEKNSQTQIFAGSNSVMLIGADVTHPSPQQSRIPSIVGACATSDPDCVRYNMQYRIQDPKKEIICSMKDIMCQHLKAFFTEQKKYPTHIIYYRDGVADGQFEQVLNDEIDRGMNLAFGEIAKQTRTNYRPKVTVIIVQKRNHTRFFPLDKSKAFGKYDNVYPGTCCSDVICHPNEKEFFLVSHESIKGTARPTKYIVIRDESNFNLGDIQNLTYNLCHLFPRCNRSVSYPAPAYLAHLVAARGKVYIENERIEMNRLNDLERRKKVLERFSLGNPMFFV